jgi:hypothetical protein
MASVAQASELEIAKFVAVNCKASAENCGESAELGKDVFGAKIAETEEPELAESIAQGFTQAGGHVPFGVTDFTVTPIAGALKNGNAIPNKAVTHVRVDVSPGLATSPVNVPQCSTAQFNGEAGSEHSAVTALGFFLKPECPEGAGPHKTGPTSTVIGEETAIVYAGEAGDVNLSGTLYNLVQLLPSKTQPGRASTFGAALKLPIPISKAVIEENVPALKGSKSPILTTQYYVHTTVEGNVEWGKEAKGTNAGDYHDYFEVNVSPALPLVRARQINYGQAGNGAFITNGTNCAGSHTSTVKLEGVALGSVTQMLTEEAKGETQSGKRPYETKVGLDHCNLVPFEPTFGLTSSSTGSDTPNQVTTETGVPHFTGAEEIDSSQVKTATIRCRKG